MTSFFHNLVLDLDFGVGSGVFVIDLARVEVLYQNSSLLRYVGVSTIYTIKLLHLVIKSILVGNL